MPASSTAHASVHPVTDDYFFWLSRSGWCVSEGMACSARSSTAWSGGRRRTAAWTQTLRRKLCLPAPFASASSRQVRLASKGPGWFRFGSGSDSSDSQFYFLHFFLSPRLSHVTALRCAFFTLFPICLFLFKVPPTASASPPWAPTTP